MYHVVHVHVALKAAIIIVTMLSSPAHTLRVYNESLTFVISCTETILYSMTLHLMITTLRITVAMA